MLKVGLIGMGGVGVRHFHNCMHLRNARLLAVADASKRARSLAKSKGVKEVYDDYNKLLENPSIDCVIIALPTYLHKDCTVKSVQSGKHVFVEKPLARNTREAEEIIDTISHHSETKVMVGYPLRFSQRFRRLKDEIENGSLGNIIDSCLTNIGPGPFYHRSRDSIPKPVPSWWFDRHLTGGGALLDLGSHMINLARWFFGGRITSVCSYLYHNFNLDIEDQAICLMKSEDGPELIVNVGWFSQDSTVKVDLFGTVRNRTVHLGNNRFSRIKHLLAAKSPGDSFYLELEHFIDCIRNNVRPINTAEDALEDLILISKAYESGTVVK